MNMKMNMVASFRYCGLIWMDKYIITYCDLESNVTDTVTIYAHNVNHAIKTFQQTHDLEFEIIKID